MDKKIRLNPTSFVTRSDISNPHKNVDIIEAAKRNNENPDQEYEEIMDSNWYVTRVKKQKT
jgi:hypothetical protein